MKPGPPPKPTALKKAEGNPGKRALNDREPTCDAGTSVPSWLSPRAKKYWRRAYPHLRKAGLVTALDRETLADWCCACALFEEAEDGIAKYGLVLPTKDKTSFYQSPFVGMATTASKRIRQLGDRMGLSPAARVRLTVEQGETTDPLEELLKKKAAACKPRLVAVK